MMKRSLVFLLAFLMLAAQQMAFAGAAISLAPSTTSAQAGSSGVKFDVMIDTDTSIASIMTLLTWDTNVLELEDDNVEYASGFDYDDFTFDYDDGLPGIAVIGIAKAMLASNVITAPFNGKIMTLSFKVKDGLETGPLPNVISLSFDQVAADAAEFSETLETLTVDNDQIESVASGASINIVKLFNVAAKADESKDWEINSSLSYDLGTNLVYTNENGTGVDGKVTAIDNANIKVKVGNAEDTYPAAKFGAFELLDANDGTLSWNGKVTEAIGHNKLEFVIPFTAASKDNPANTDKNTFTWTITQANAKPVVNDFEIVTEDGFAMIETNKVKFKFTITDANGDVTYPKEGTAKLNGTTLAGAFTKDDETGIWTFTGTEELSQDLVSHTLPITYNNNYYIKWKITFDVTDDYDTVKFEKESGEMGIQDVDRPVSKPTFSKFEPAEPTTVNDITVVYGEATDEDEGDTITYTIVWSCGNKEHTGETLPKEKTVKGEKWNVTIYATSKVGNTTKSSEDFVEAEITIGNSKPELKADKERIFIRKGSETTGIVEFTITDADEADEFTVTANGDANGNVEASAVADGKFTVTYTVTNENEFDGQFTVKVNDRDADSNEIPVAVTYKSNEPAVIEVIKEATEPIDEVDASGNASEVVLKIKATDSTAVAPYGIQSITWTITDGEGNIVFGTETSKVNPARADLNYPAEDEMEVIVKTNGYATLDGKGRAASAVYKVKVVVRDALEAPTDKEFTITVNDVDRLATAPTSLGLAEGTLHTGDTIATNPEGAEDADGDDVSYKVVLTVGGEEVANDYAVKKGDVVTVKAVATSKAPYDEEAKDGGELTATLDAVANTAPVITVPDGDGAVEIDEYIAVEGYDVADATLTIGEDAEVKFAYTDIDEAVGADAVKVTVDSTGLAGYATADIVDGKLVITREPNVNTVGVDELPYFTLKATDQDGEVAEAKFNLTIKPVNTKPVVTVAEPTVYIVPGVELKPIEFAVTFGTSADEAGQLIESIEKNMADADGIFANFSLEPSDDGKTVIFTGTVSDNIAALAGKEATLTFKVKDNGGEEYDDTSDEVTVKFAVSSTPWYPIYTVPCNEHQMHQVTLTGDGDTVTLIVESDTIYPGDYYNQGCKGLKSGVTYSVKCWAWSPADGAAAVACDEVGELNVITYEKPGKATVKVTDGSAANKKNISVEIPMASKYTVTINRDGSLYKTISKDFTPDDNGFITPSVEFEIELPDGDYEVTAIGANPAGVADEASEPVPFSITGNAPELEWPDGAFMPNGGIDYIGANVTETTVRFNWPIVSAATKYVLCIENVAGGIYEELESNANSYEYTFKKLGAQTDISWWVIAKNANDELSSDQFSFSIVRQSDNAIITGVTSLGGGQLLISIIKAHENVKVFTNVTVQLAHFNGNNVTWYSANASVTEVDGGVTVTINGNVSEGDIIYIRPSTSKETEWLIFTVKSAR